MIKTMLYIGETTFSDEQGSTRSIAGQSSVSRPQRSCVHISNEWLLDGLMALEFGHRGCYVHKAQAIRRKERGNYIGLLAYIYSFLSLLRVCTTVLTGDPIEVAPLAAIGLSI